MEKAEMLEEIRCELGLLAEKVKRKEDWYHSVITLLKVKVPYYQTVTIYLTNETAFNYFDHCSSENEKINKEPIPFGEEFLSIVAARGEISCEFEPGGQSIYVPFYKGHHLLGEIVIKTSQYVDDQELKFMKNIQTILGSAPF